MFDIVVEENILTYSICHRVEIYRFVNHLAFLLICLVYFPPLTTTLRFSHSSLMNTSLCKSFTIPMSSLSISSRSSSTVKTFYKGFCSSSIKKQSSLKIKSKKLEKSVSVSANIVSSIPFRIKDSLPWFYQKNCKSIKSASQKMIG